MPLAGRGNSIQSLHARYLTLVTTRWLLHSGYYAPVTGALIGVGSIASVVDIPVYSWA